MQHHDAWIDPATHQVQQTIYMASYNDKPAEADDIFKILANVPPQDVVDAGRAEGLQAGDVRSHALATRRRHWSLSAISSLTSSTG